MKTWRAALYLRLSKEDGDKEESESITNQRALLTAFAGKLDDVCIVAEKIDDGWSGANFQRPGFIEMMDEIRAGALDCVIVKDLTRFGRSFGEAGKYIEHIFPFLGVRFISVNDSIDSANKRSAADDIIVPFLNLVSDAYCRDISIKIRTQLEIKRQKGEFVGAFPVFGYKRDPLDNNRLIIDEPAADIVRLIYRWKLDGQSAETTAKNLNALGIQSPMAYKKALGMKYFTPFAKTSDTQWSAMAVLRILKDETYTGVTTQGKTGTPNHKIKKKIKKPLSEWARVDGTHEAVIKADEFDAVSRLLLNDTRTAPGNTAVYPFSGIAKCGICGENLIRKTSWVNGRAYVYFVCCRNCAGSRISEGLMTDCATIALLSHISTSRMDMENLVFYRKAEQIVNTSRSSENWDFTVLSRRAAVSFIDSVTVYPGSRLVIGLRFRYPFQQKQIKAVPDESDGNAAV
jgi:DNA invertase Pin-like site-specific DNA recombinase